MIQPEALIAKFRLALTDHWGYIWGKAGSVWTEADQRAATDSMIQQYGAQWVGHRVADCSGLFTWAFSQLGGYMYHGATTMYNKYTTARGELKAGKRTDGGNLQPGTAVFIYSAGTQRYEHVGLYVGNGQVIEAKGTRYGVVESTVAKRWTHWGELKGIQYEGSEPVMTTVRKGATGDNVRELQETLNRLGYDCGRVDGVFGTKTEAAVKMLGSLK